MNETKREKLTKIQRKMNIKILYDPNEKKYFNYIKVNSDVFESNFKLKYKE